MAAESLSRAVRIVARGHPTFNLIKPEPASPNIAPSFSAKAAFLTKRSTSSS